MRFLFICGCGHSGTSLLLAIFSAANDVHALTDETHFLLSHSTCEFKSQYGYLAQGGNLIVEKTPKHVYALDKIVADPECGALVMVRNPVDVIASLKREVLMFNRVSNAIETTTNSGLPAKRPRE
ncbi:sulfotransferase domain-containing protein [Halioglobus pacificus]|uniref:Sulfotransferase domain-containing protein n=1 Tax=Parahalioglobus pacificus TaxID=930806 RepID=A0A918XI87_9GAMM|nr:sulfotransferase domain-containing protein [Halioglobus pacificus]GHD33678.1 hypothetical protein GCM10007053_18320 [Halioglobus pacificus]